LGGIYGQQFTVYTVIDLLSNKLGGVHIDPVFARRNGVNPRDKKRFEQIEAAFSLSIFGMPALRYFSGEITETVLNTLRPLYDVVTESLPS
jgi:hypothetical protein